MTQKIQSVEIQNFKGIDFQKIDISGNHVYLIAKNGGGKTSFIDAAFGSVKNAKPLKEGAKKGHVSINIDDYLVEFKFSEKNQKPKLNIFDKSGAAQSSPAALFEKLFGVQNFDIDEFLSRSASKKVDFIKNIIGIDWSDADAKYKTLYEERTFLNRIIKEFDAKIGDSILMRNTEEIDTSVLMAKSKEVNESNSTRFTIKNGVDDRIVRIEYLKKELSKLEKEVEDGSEWLDKNPIIETESIDSAIEEAIEHNQKLAVFNQQQKGRKEADEAVEKVEAIQKEMDQINEAKRSELEAADMPVKGLTFDDDQLYLDGLPFESNQINSARRIVAGLEIQYALKGDVSIARLEGSMLDKDSMNEVIDWADKKGVQLFVEKVDYDGEELKIEISES